MKIADKSIWKYTIVYYDNALSRRCAERIRAAIFMRTGVRLPLVTDSFEERDCEILVGKTSRRESAEARAEYDRPNIYYDVKIINGKLVCMGEGCCTLDRVAEILERVIASAENIVGDVAHGDLRDEPDGNMIDRADGTDVRVFDWNLNAPGNTGANLVDHAEMAADVMLRHLPDIIGTNEIYNSQNCPSYKRFYDAAVRELAPYYTLVKSDYDGELSAEGLDGDPKRYGEPPHHIFVRKNADIKSLRSGFRYTPNRVAYHAYHWGIFETGANKKFIFSVGHYEDTRNNPVCAVAHMDTVDFAQRLSGAKELLPAIITGDLFTHYGCVNGGYEAFMKAGYVDSQREAEINCNGDITFSTYHRIGQYQPRWASIDLVLCNPCAKALKFKVITSQEALDISDHCPVCADLKFN